MTLLARNPRLHAHPLVYTFTREMAALESRIRHRNFPSVSHDLGTAMLLGYYYRHSYGTAMPLVCYYCQDDLGTTILSGYFHLHSMALLSAIPWLHIIGPLSASFHSIASLSTNYVCHTLALSHDCLLSFPLRGTAI
jgi:hypothetical protein